MIVLTRLNYDNPAHLEWQREAWGWMLRQPEYMAAGGYSADDFEVFRTPRVDTMEIAATAEDGALVALFVVIGTGGRRYQAHIVTAPEHSYRQLRQALFLLRENLFLGLMAHEITAPFPESGARRMGVRRLARQMGMRILPDGGEISVWDWMATQTGQYIYGR